MSDEQAPRDPRPLEEEPAEPPARAEPVVVPRWIQLVFLPLAALGLFELARAAGPVLLIFIVAAVAALILNPLVTLLERGRLPRGLAVLAVYVGAFLVMAVVILVLANPVANQVSTLRDQVPGLIDSANRSLAGVQGWLDARGIDIEITQPGSTALETLRDNLVAGSGEIVSFTGELLRRFVEAAFALILVLVLSIYMLLYGHRIGAVVRSAMPSGDGSPEDDYPTRAQKAVFGYVRGQLAFSLIMGTSAGAALWVFGALGIFPAGRTYAVAFGAFFGLMEIIPYVGPIIGPLPAILVALFQDPITAVWVGLLFLALQQLEGHVVAPQVFGHSLRINPLLVIFALLLGGKLYGIVGALVALPLAAVARETAVYLRRHLVLEPWGTPRAGALGAGSVVRSSATTRCASCGAPGDEDDAYCRRCSAPLAGDTFAAGHPGQGSLL